jgi:alpha-glucosidase
MQLEILGNANSVTEQNGALVIKTQQAEARIWVFSPTIIRICISRDFSEANESFAVIEKPLESFSWQHLTDAVEVTTSALKLIINLIPLCVLSSSLRMASP